MLAARGLSWRAGGRTVLGPLDLELAHGECFALVGPNGAGKTTLLRLLAGVLAPASGEVRYDGRPYSALSRRELARRVAYVPQVRPARVPFTVEELVLQGRFPYLSTFQLSPREADFRAVREALGLAGVEHLAGRRLDELSGGERQAAYIAAALAQEGETLLLDEPTTHLDPRHQRDVASILIALKARGDKTVVFATHDLNFASRLADRVAALQEGRLLACGRPAELLAPELLAELFAAPFTVVAPGERPLTLLAFDGEGGAEAGPP